MLDIALPEKFTPEFMALIPAQRKHINQLMRKRVVASYTLSADRQRLWVVMNARSVQEVKSVLGKFPIIEYIDVEVHDIVFHNTPENTLLPAISLN